MLKHLENYFQTTLCGLESYLPMFFEGAMDTYERMKKSKADKQNHANYLKPLSQDNKNYLRTKLVMQNDMDFYNWAVQRFHRQIEQLGGKCQPNVF